MSKTSHKFISLLLALSISGAGSIAFAEEGINTGTGYDEYTYKASVILTGSLTGESLFEGDPEKNVTRGEFVNAVVKLFDLSGNSSAELPYKDVDSENKYFGAIGAAYAGGLISESDNFYPEKEILYPEALKIMFHAARYEKFLKAQGTYPAAYLKMAAEQDIAENVRINADQTVNSANAQILLYNLLHAEASDVSDFKAGYPTYELGPETNLESFYDIKYFEGLVTSTGCNSIIMNDEINTRESEIGIDGEKYYGQWLEPELLGKWVTAYCYEEDSVADTVCCVIEKEKKNAEKTVCVKDFDEISDSKLYYFDNSGRKKSVNLEDAYKVVYNGRRVSKLEDYMLENNATEMRLLSNDGDNEFEIIFIDGFSYGYVTGINTFDEEIGIKFPGETVYLNAKDENVVKKIYDSNGKEMELFELANNVVVGVKKSDDGCLYEIRVCENIIYGKVVSVDRENNVISLSKKEYVDNRELDARYEETVKQYEMAKSFVREYADKIKAGDELSAVTGLNGELVYLNSGEFRMVYGYLQKMYVADGESGEEYMLKILEMDGEFGKYKLSDKVTIDAVSKKSADAYNLINKDFTPQVIKYSFNSDGEINTIDFASSDVSGFGEKPENSRDSLVKFYSRASMRYRAGCRGFNSKALMLNAQILAVPNNTDMLDESENYTIGDYNLLVSDNTYTADVFNIDEYGMAEFAVVYVDAKAPPSARSIASSVVCKVYTSYNDELSEVGRTVVCRDVTSFKSYFLPENVTISKTSGADICPGDIVRVYEQDGVVKEIFTDIDYSSGSPVFDSLHGASNDEAGNASLVFVKGKMYSQGTSSYVLSDITMDGATYDYSYENLRPYYATGNIVLFDSDTEDARNISKSELKTYQGYGDECDYVIIRQNYTSPSVMFVIR